MEDSSDRWLLLEQMSDRTDWCHRDLGHLIFNESGIQPREGAPTGSPAEREICILFLPERNGSWALPDAYTNRFAWRWNVWCHYGHDISLAECSKRWQSYERLSDLDKAGLSRKGHLPPLPFSRGMPQPWSNNFNKLKDNVRQRLKTGGAGDHLFTECLGLLRGAWGLAKGAQGIQALLEQSREALPALLAAQCILAELPAHVGFDTQTRKATLASVLSRCREIGLLAMADRKELFSDTVRDAYRHLGFTVFYLHDLTVRKDKTIRGQDLDLLRLALRRLLSAADADAATTTKALMHHP